MPLVIDLDCDSYNGSRGTKTSTGFLLPFFTYMHGLELDVIELTLDEGNPQRIDWMDPIRAPMDRCNPTSN